MKAAVWDGRQDVRLGRVDDPTPGTLPQERAERLLRTSNLGFVEFRGRILEASKADVA
jgi:hypothetical protein